MRTAAPLLLLPAVCGAVDPPGTGSLFCGGIPGILNSNLTVKSATSIDYFNDITIANIVVNCPGEAFVFEADTGVLNIDADMADPTNCFAKASAQDGGSTFTFTYDGSATIASKNSKWGSIDLKLASGATCAAASLQKARVAPPAVGSLFCGGIPGILNSNLTVKSATSMDYFNDITIANIVVNCPGEAFVFEADTGVLNIDADMADPTNCFAKASAQDGGSTFTFTYDGSATIASKNSKWGSIDLKKASGATCAAASLQKARVAPPAVGSLFCGGIPGILNSNLTVKSATSMDYFNDITIANIVVNCPGEAFVFEADTGVLNIEKDMADPTNCFAKASAQDGGSTFTFTYDGSATIASKNSKWGSIDLKQTTGAACSS